MSGRRQDAIRKLLRPTRNGMTVRQIVDKLSMHSPWSMRVVRSALTAMPDVYICGWAQNEQDKWVARWSCVTPPPPAPRPR